MQLTANPLQLEMVTTTTMIDHANAPRIVIRGFKPGHTSNLSGQSSFVLETDASQNCDIIQDHRMCPQSPMAHISTTDRIPINNDVSPRPSQGDTSEEGVTIETDSGDEIDESAIEDSDDGLWEDEDNEESGPHSAAKPLSFQRGKSEPNLALRQSLLTSALHQVDRPLALQNAASRSSPAIRCFRTSTPNGPSTSNSPQEDSGLMMTRSQTSRSKPIIMTTSNVHPPAMSPKTTRRNMLAFELTTSLRQGLLWERQQKNATTDAVTKRQTSADGLPALRRAMTMDNVKSLNNNVEQQQQQPHKSSATKNDSKPDSHYNQFFEDGLGGYNKSGW